MEKLMESKTWDAAAARVVKIIFQILNAEYVDVRLGLKDIRRMYDEVWAMLSTNPEFSGEAAFFNVGAAALRAAGAAGVEINEENLVETLVRKQNDYGPENIARFGRDGILVRLHDKIARLENLASSGRDPKNESVSDNYLDVIGYCTVGVMWESGEFLLPLTVVESNQE
jgi:hypothetical protein